MRPTPTAEGTRPAWAAWVRPVLLTLTVVASLVSCGGSQPSNGPAARHQRPIVAPGRDASRSHVAVIVMENKEKGEVLGSPSAPYLTRLAKRYGVATQAHGIRHPSLPNYIALISGSTQGITDDCTSCQANAPNLADQLEVAHRGWGAYLEGLPAPCARPAFAGRFAKKHDPFAYDEAIARSRSRCRRRLPLSQLARDVSADRLPAFVYIAPDLCNDTHDCPVATGDRFLARLVPGLLPALGPHGFLIVTYDEGTTSSGCCGGSVGGRIPTVVAGPDIRRHGRMGEPVDEYGMLRTLEDAFGLAHLGQARLARHGSLNPLFRRAPTDLARPRAPAEQ